VIAAFEMLEEDLVSLLPVGRDVRLTGEGHAGEARLVARHLAGVAVERVIDDGLEGDAVGAQAVDDGLVEARHLGEVRVGVQRVLVAREPIQEGLLRQGRGLDRAVGRAIRRLVARLGAGVAAEATLTANEQREAVGEQVLAGFVLRGRLQDHERRLALVVDLRNRARDLELLRRRDRLVDLDVLLPVEQHGEVEVHPGDAREAAHGAERRDHREARQHLEILLVGVLELLRVGLGGARADAEAQVVEDHLILGVGRFAFGELRAPGLVGIDGHVALLRPDRT
jgi:hypothetical protein